MTFSLDVAIVGGCGRVGLPLGLAFAQRGLQVGLYDINAAAVETVTARKLPFDEPEASSVLQRVAGKNLIATSDPSVLSTAEHVVFVIGTPVDEHLNPDPQAIPSAVADLSPHLISGQVLVLRSTT